MAPLYSQHKGDIEDAHVANDSISSQNISHLNSVNPKPEDSLLSKSDTLSKSIFRKVNMLDKVYISSKSKFNVVSLGIIKEETKPLTVYERKLYTAGDFKPIHLLSILGGTLAVDPIINAISGRTKRMKKYIQIEKKEKNIMFLEDHFTDYMRENLNIPEDSAGRFLNYLVEHEKLQELIDRKDFGELYFFIGDKWFEFKGRMEDSIFDKTDTVKTPTEGG